MRITDIGAYPVWLNDSRRLLFRQGGNLYLLEHTSGNPQILYALKAPNQIGSHAISRDNRRIYFSEISSEADIWLLKLN